MTKEAPRPYTPETREVPLTFLCCEDIGLISNWCLYGKCGSSTFQEDCTYLLKCKLCPKGYSL